MANTRLSKPNSPAGLLEGVLGELHNDDRRYEAFKKRYKNDRVAFVRDCFEWPEGQGPAFYQDDILRLLDEGENRLSWRGPRGCRKTSSVAWIILHFILTHDRHPHRDWKVGMTASVGRQLTEFLWPEVHKWIGRVKWDVVGREPFKEGTELLGEKIIGHRKSQAYSFVSNDPDKVEGCHADDVLLVFDESKAIPEASVDAVLGGITGAGKGTDQKAIVIAISTPGPPSGWFYDIHRGSQRFSRWKALHITEKMCLDAGSLSEDGLQELADKCGGRESARFKQQGLGEFAADDESGVIALEHVERAIERGYEWRKAGCPERMTSLGFDVADGGKDDSVLAPCHGFHVADLVTLKKYPKIDNDGVSQTMAMVGEALDYIQQHDIECPTIVVDANGAGAGVASRLKEISSLPKSNFTVQSFIAQKTLKDKKVKKRIKGKESEIAFGEEVPADTKSAAWLEVAWMLDPESGVDISLPDNPQLVLELTTMQRLPPGSDGKVKVMTKDKQKELLGGKSPDLADAVVMGLTAGRLSKKKRKARVLGRD